jgi:hypothetical protein
MGWQVRHCLALARRWVHGNGMMSFYVLTHVTPSRNGTTVTEWEKAAQSTLISKPLDKPARKLCAPGMRAIEGTVVDLLAPGYPTRRLREWQSEHFGHHELLIFLNVSAKHNHALTVKSDRDRPLNEELVNHIKQLIASVSTDKIPVAPAIILYDRHPELRPTAEIISVSVKLQQVLPNIRLFADQTQGEQYEQLNLASFYQCEDKFDHVAYFIRPDAYVGARAQLKDASQVFQSYLRLFTSADA